jgi:hypothetical protein
MNACGSHDVHMSQFAKYCRSRARTLTQKKASQGAGAISWLEKHREPKTQAFRGLLQPKE